MYAKMLVSKRPLQVRVVPLREFLAALLRGVGDEDVEATECLHRALDHVVAEIGVGKVAGNQFTSPFAFLHGTACCLGVTLFLRQVDDRDIGAFTRVKHGNGASDA